MTSRISLLSILPACLACAVIAAFSPLSTSAETIFFGSTHQVDGPFDPDLDLSIGTVGVAAISGNDWVTRDVPFYTEGNANYLHGFVIAGATAGQAIPNFGATIDDDQLEWVFNGGRHLGPTINVPVTVGHSYKIRNSLAV